MPSQAVADALTRVQNTRLKANTNAMGARAEALGGSVKKGGPSVLERIFGTLKHGESTFAEPVARLVEGKSIGDAARGAISGLVHGKTGGSEILERGAQHSGAIAGINKNKALKSAVALGLDVVLDPFTYVTGGLESAAAKGAMQTARAGAIAEHFAQPGVLKAIEEGGQAVKAAKEAKYAAKGVDVATKEKTIADAVRKGEGVARRAAYPEALEKGKAAAAALKAESPGKATLKFMGKKVAESEKVYDVASKAGKAITATKFGNTANRAFRTAAVFPEITNVLKRESELRGLARTEQEIRAMQKVFHGLKPHEIELVTHAAEAGPVKDAITGDVAKSSLHGVSAENGKDLGEVVDHFREVTDTRLQHETDVGVHRDKKTGKALTFEQARKENYVPHYYKTSVDEEAALKKLKAIGPDKPGFTMPQKIESVAHAKSLGMDVETQADKILARRIHASHKSIARAEWAKGVAENFGVDMAGNEARKLFYGKEGKKNLAELGYKRVVNPHVPKTMLFPAHIAESFNAMEAAHSSDKIAREFLQHFDKFQNEWKFWNTAANPGHHIRNMVGDVWNNFVLGGVKNPERYKQAGQLVYGEPEKFAMKVGEKTLSGSDVLRHQIESGAKPAFTSAELSKGEGSFLHGFKGKVADIADKRENFTRTANFIEQFKRAGAHLTADSTEAEIKAAAREAGRKVRHINIDFGDLTDFEKKYMKRLVPFYTWSRKNLPLQIEALAMHPGRVLAMPKGTTAIENLLGTKSQDGDQGDVLPKWLKEMSSISLRRGSSGKNPRVLNLNSIPFSDIGRFTEGGQQGILRNLVSQLNPIARAPIEQAFGQKAFSGTPVGGNADYLAGQVSPLNQAYKLLTGKQKVMSPQTFNYLTGAGVQEITPGQQASELRRQQQPLKKTIRNLKKKKTGG